LQFKKREESFSTIPELNGVSSLRLKKIGRLEGELEELEGSLLILFEANGIK